VFQKDASLRRSRLWKEHIEKLAQINQFIVSQNSVPGIQLAHAGRKAQLHGMVDEGSRRSGGWDSVA
jgi:2,4-dienoyl-CoA reductase-like NADH-dependent reductase (Old Yellow Enzyme family)